MFNFRKKKENFDETEEKSAQNQGSENNPAAVEAAETETVETAIETAIGEAADAIEEKMAENAPVAKILVGEDAAIPEEAESEKENEKETEKENEKETEKESEKEIAKEPVKSEKKAEEEEEIEAAFSEEAMGAAFEDWLTESIPDDGRRAAAREAMKTLKNSMESGNFDEAVFDMIAKAADYERAVNEASEEGEIRGRNAQIDSLFEEAAAEGDGLPHPGAAAQPGGKKRASIFDLARSAY